MIIEQTSHFAKAMKKLHGNQREQIESAVRIIIQNPAIGELKKGDLTSVRVYKFSMVKQLTLLAYSYSEERITLRLLMFGSHENFYRDLKNLH